MLASCGDVRNSTVGPKRSTRRPVVGFISVLTCFSPWFRGSGARLRQHLLTRQTERQRSNRSRSKNQKRPIGGTTGRSALPLGDLSGHFLKCETPNFLY